jgi:hypothetical protein
MFRQFIAAITLISFTVYMCVVPTVAYASEPDTAPAVDNPYGLVTTLRLGDPAPFDGTLFSVPAAARILTDLEFTQAQCELQINRRLLLQKSEFQLQLDTQFARYTALELRHGELMLLKTQQIDFLTENYQPRKWFESGEFWFAMGVVGGVLITVGAGYAIGQAN